MGRHAIELALDLARMPSLARSYVAPPIPSNIVEVMHIAAASPSACQEAALVTGESETVLVEAARFYLQQLLFRPGADCYRVLGLQPGAPRDTARNHMRLLLLWLHPDRNSNLEAIYAERVLKAWREISAPDSLNEPSYRSRASLKKNGRSPSFRLPWIERPAERRRRRRALATWILAPGLMISFVLLSAAVYFVGPEQMFAMIRLR